MTQNEAFDEATRHYEAKNFKAAFPLFKKLAEQGHAVAQISLGQMYYKGEGVTRDPKKSAYWGAKGWGQFTLVEE